MRRDNKVYPSWYVDEEKEMIKELSTNVDEQYLQGVNYGVSTSCDISNGNSIDGLPYKYGNRKERRDKEKAINPHELNIGRIAASSVDNTNQKQKKKNFNNFIKSKVR